MTLLQKEVAFRSTSAEYVAKWRLKLEALPDDAPFDETLFRRAIAADPSLGRLFLNDCLSPDRHTLGFTKVSLQSRTMYLWNIYYL